ncbi:BMP family ABC transporter substrate-binding protein [Microbacterium sp. EYE_5]|uniref:BMP family lipoprotein n=1 Tax=unclassified Microbacterium TaxID=2609290 RepID=UPI002005B2A1|nr:MULTISPECIES: BMP family ABC transporter substrate-binding protein [unclassified Microbacterium]MCK6081566.1 BMP family ABC transporter substrate-binding protein [Microbacterium sp. EYE_382]MCK6086836.1 BMP family ABC transporter substrate-binding protein [Microbacterium sp. EYE_384]MCK6123666.1 BMP family ABC transporter substrate-binding protein [Microbacterium sp. EYE_80]MCK6126575.1 BMP family ABC transporter substrate-binding protein [Microbacterium sp. EYE_79]MCK6142520.1 BMP family A
MTISNPKKLAGIAGAALLLAALAGCGTAPEADPSAAPGGSSDVVDGFKPCLISDAGGWNDKSFNESAKNGMDKAAEELGIEPLEFESTNDNDYEPNMTTAVSEGCTLIVSVGFKLAAATVEAATANPDLQFAIIDDYADTDQDGATDAENIKPLVFNTAEAAYLGGYAAASWSAEAGVNKVGTFGGLQIPSVAVFMDGYALGVEKYNEDKGADVQLFGWDVAGQKGAFTGGFDANDTAKQTAQSVLDQGVDVILPVGGPIYQSAAAAISDSGEDTLMLGVDSDLAVADDSVADITLVSIMKAIDVAVYDATVAASSGDFDAAPYIGTLENEGVKLSGFHDFESQLPDGLADELAALQESIIAGDITVESKNSP